MLLPAELKTFFESNNIPLDTESVTSCEQCDVIFIEALKYGTSFGSFILCSVLNPERNGIWTRFDSWENLYECYCAFMTGFMLSSNAKNN